MKGSLFYNMMMHELLNDSISWFLCWAIEFTISFHLHDITGHQLMNNVLHCIILLRICIYNSISSFSCTAQLYGGHWIYEIIIWFNDWASTILIFSYLIKIMLMITISHFHDQPHHMHCTALLSVAWSYCLMIDLFYNSQHELIFRFHI